MTFAPGQRVRSIFDDKREGVVVKSAPEGNRDAILIEFEDHDESDGNRPFTHRLWLPSRHWEAA